MSDSIDVYMGRRLRRRRVLLELTQRELGDAVGVSFQQIHKYESGEHRMTAGMLWKLSCKLNATPSYFYDGYSADGHEISRGENRSLAV